MKHLDILLGLLFGGAVGYYGLGWPGLLFIFVIAGFELALRILKKR